MPSLPCAQCPVSRQCITAALERGEYGIWGGTSERERRKLKRRGGSAGPCPRCGICFTWHDRSFGAGRDYCGRCLTYFDVMGTNDEEERARRAAAARTRRRNRAATVTSSDAVRGLEDTA